MKFERNCPKCNSIVVYKHKGSMTLANKNNSVCSTCCSELYGWNKINKEVSDGIRNNGFLGKNHTIKTKEQLTISRNSNGLKYKTDSFRKKISNATEGSKNPMYGKKFYDIWLNKYGKTEADLRLEAFKKKVSLPGELNGMYGKPSPQGSGNGWSGWYKDWFFRSLKELHYMINVIEKNNLEWDCGEKKQYSVKWTLNGINKTYHSDFIIGNRMIEIKPKSLWNSKNVQLKAIAANDWCSLNGMTYELVDVPSFDINEIQVLLNSGLLKFTNRYNEKYKQLTSNTI